MQTALMVCLVFLILALVLVAAMVVRLTDQVQETRDELALVRGQLAAISTGVDGVALRAAAITTNVEGVVKAQHSVDSSVRAAAAQMAEQAHALAALQREFAGPQSMRRPSLPGGGS